jgi:hypothetical protein
MASFFSLLFPFDYTVFLIVRQTKLVGNDI